MNECDWWTAEWPQSEPPIEVQLASPLAVSVLLASHDDQEAISGLFLGVNLGLFLPFPLSIFGGTLGYMLGVIYGPN